MPQDDNHVTNIHSRTDTDAAFEAAKELLPVQVHELADHEGFSDAVRVLSIPKGREVRSIKGLLDEYRVAPERRKGTAVFSDLASFIVHAKRFGDADSVIFADDSRTAPSVVSVLDYHRATPDGAPRFGQHRGAYTFPLSDEWIAWTAQNGAAMKQADFARFIEDRLADVADPSSVTGSALEWAARIGVTYATPSKLLELSRGLTVRVNQSVRNEHALSNGISQINFATEHTDPNGAPLDVPGALVVAVPVFRRGAPYAMPVRLRYRIGDGKIAWSFELARVDAVFEHALGEALDLVASQTSLPVLRGKPEA